MTDTRESDPARSQNRIVLLLATLVAAMAVFAHRARRLTYTQQAELTARLARAHAVVATAADAMLTIDAAGVVQSINAAAAHTFGYAADEVVGQNVGLLIPELDYSLLDLSSHTDAAARTATRREVIGRRKDASTFPVELSVGALQGGQQPICTVIARDITDRKRAQERVEQSELQLAEAQRLAHLGSWEWDIAANTITWSDELYRIFGLRPNEFGATFEAFLNSVHPEDRERTGQIVAEALGTHQPFHYDSRIVRPDGTVRIIEAWGKVALDPAGRPARMVGTALDITERKQVEEQLSRTLADLKVHYDTAEQARSESRAVLDAANEVMVLIDPDQRIISVNRRFADVFGLPPDAVVGRRLTDVQDIVQRVFADPPGQDSVLGRAYMHDEEFRGVVMQRWPATRELELYATPVRGPDGGDLGRLFVFRDITRERAVDRMKSEFISTVSHELRTPLTSIRGSLGLIVGGVVGDLPPQAKEMLAIAYNNSERLVRLINDILDIEKLESGKLVFHLKPLALMPLIEQAIEANRAYGAPFGVTFVLEASVPGAMVNADSDRLMQVLANLLSNAAKFSPPNETVTIAVTQQDQTIRVGVTDRGPGIPAAFRDRIFQKFAQADASDTRQKGGTGLGLSISKAIIEMHGGEIGFAPAGEAGTTFYFDLPAWQPVAAPVRDAPQLPGQPRILICEDDPDIAALLSMVLQQGGFRTDIAYTAAQAKQLLAQHAYDGMTLDILLPDQHGIALLGDLRMEDRTRSLPIVVVSLVADESREVLNGDAIGVVDWLEKPINTARLRAAVEQAVRVHANGKARVLHVEDDPDLVTVVTVMLREVAEVAVAATLQEAHGKLEAEHFDLVILDVQLPDGSGLDVLPLLNGGGRTPVPVIVFSAQEVGAEIAEQVSATLVKARTSNEMLLDTITSLVPWTARRIDEERNP